MNDIKISGRLTRDAEVIQTKSEWNIVKFSIANDDEWDKDSNGRVPSFFDCVYFTKNTSYWQPRLTKGASVILDGSLKQETWQQDGQNRSKITIKVNAGQGKGFPITLIGEGETKAPAKASWKGAGDNPFNSTAKKERFEDDDDIPF